jgi:hypothetical protein
MKVMRLSDDLISKYKTLFSPLGRWLACLFFCSLYLNWGIERFFDSIYAEDGTVFLQEALFEGPIVSLTNTYAGYLDVPARLVGSIVSLFHPVNYALINSLLLVLLISFFQSVVYSLFMEITNSKFYSVLISIYFVTIPIGRFESLGNIANLHFYSLSICGLLFLKNVIRERLTKFDFLILIILSFGSPLSIMFSSLVLLFIAINSILRKNETIDRRFNRGKLLFSASINSTIVTTSLILGWNNATNRLQSLNFGIDDFVRATYLFLDRVIASSFLPFWGHVSQQEDGVVLITSRIFGNLEIRLVLGVFLALIVAIGILVVNFRERIVLVTILLNVFVYSFVLGITFGLQPRYSLVASFLLQNCVFLVLALSEKSDRKSLVIKIISLVVILLQISTTKID